jgi:uncharacterized protein (DUF2164 family)
MKLDQPITILPPPSINNSGAIDQPEPIVLSELDVTYIDNPKSRTYHVAIQPIPQTTILFEKEDYDAAGLITRQQAEEKLRLLLGSDPAAYIRSLYPKTIGEDPHGPGTVLSQMIKTMGIKMTENCSCKRHALEMNKQGNDWCEKNIDTIVGWLRAEAERRKLPFIDALGKIFVNRAIKKSRKLLANEKVPDNDEELDNL